MFSRLFRDQSKQHHRKHGLQGLTSDFQVVEGYDSYMEESAVPSMLRTEKQKRSLT